MKKDFFVSYHSNLPDKNNRNYVARRIHDVLKRKCYSDYYNPEDIEFNEQYAERLHTKVKECKIFIWIITADYFELRKNDDGSIARNWFLAEILWAYKYKKRICIVIDKETYKDVSIKEVANAFLKGFEPLYNFKNYNAFINSDKILVEKFVDELANGGSKQSNSKCGFGQYNKIYIEKTNSTDEKSRNKEITRAAKDIIKITKNENKNKKKWVNGSKPIRVYRRKLWFIHILSFVFFVFGLFVYNIFTKDPTIWDGESVIKVDSFDEAYSGDGTEKSPYIVETARQLAYMAYVSQYDSEEMDGKYFRLKNDITLNDNYNLNKPGLGMVNYIPISDKKDEKNDSLASILGYRGKVIPNTDVTNVWIPIGNQEHPFGGIFDGNNKTISGLYINNTENMQGLFGCCSENSKITNVNLKACVVKGNDFVGAVVGNTEGCVDDCNVNTIVVSAHSYVGGIAGKAAVLTNSSSSGIVDLEENENSLCSDEDMKYFGGLVGECDYIVNSAAKSIMFTALDNVDCIGGLAGVVKRNIYNVLVSDIQMMSYEPEFYFENKDVPVKVCDVVGSYKGIVNKYLKDRNVRYCGNCFLAFQVDKEKYNDMIFNDYEFPLFRKVIWGNDVVGVMIKSGYKERYGIESNTNDVNSALVDRKNFNILKKKLMIGNSEFTLHDYSEEGYEYNLISEIIECDETSVKLFDDYVSKVTNIQELNEIIAKYGIKLHQWRFVDGVMEVN